MPRLQASRSTTPRRGSARRKSVHAQSLRAATIAAACAPEADLRALATDTRSDPGPPKPSDPRARPIASTPRSPACFRMGVGTCFTRGAYGRTGDLSCPAGLPNHKRPPRGFTRRVPRPRTGTIDIRSMLDCLSGNISLNHGHFWPRGQYMRRLGQDVSSADEIGIALVIAGDTSKHSLPCGCADRPYHKRDMFGRCLTDRQQWTKHGFPVPKIRSVACRLQTARNPIEIGASIMWIFLISRGACDPSTELSTDRPRLPANAGPSCLSCEFMRNVYMGRAKQTL
jgi:hypothetical protein